MIISKSTAEERLSRERKHIDLDATYEFYDPHPGFAGAAIPIPREIKAVADALNGQTMTLREAVARLEGVGIGTIRVIPKYSFIMLELGSITLSDGKSVMKHGFRVIKYR